MTKRQHQARARKVQKELIERIRKRFPRAELISAMTLPSGRLVIDVYAPYDDKFAVLDTIIDRVQELTYDEGFPVEVLPLSQKPKAKIRRRAA